jgi:hypothetical protein
MKSLLIALLILSAWIPSHAQTNYMWLTDEETTPLYEGEVARFFGRDTIWGPLHSNGWIATQNVGGLPVFYDIISTSMPSFRSGSPNPAGRFLGGDPIFNAPIVQFPVDLTYIRDAAEDDARYYSIPWMEWRCEIVGSNLRIYYYPEGTFFDSLQASSFVVALSPDNVFFFDGPLDLAGELNTDDIDLIIGCSRDIRLIDNVMLQGTNISNGVLPAGATSRIAIASEEQILIANTYENGRGNCTNGNHSNNNHALCHIVVTAYLVSLGFGVSVEQLNDSFDWYVSPSNPDERGNFIMTGGMAQRYRGLVHRSNNGGTGYNKILHYDHRMQDWNIGAFFPFTYTELPDTFYFEDTNVGTTALDTIVITTIGPFSGAFAGAPFGTTAGYQFSGPFHVPISFTPPAVGPFYGTLTFFLAGNFQSIALRGNGIRTAPPITTEVFPNPFNNISTLRLTLPEAAHVRAVVYDILGREVAKLADTTFPAGPHTLAVDGSRWASGLYFLRTESLGQVQTRKLMLLK